MPDPSKTIFISYRRSVSSYHARAIFQDLRGHGYDVFMDVESIDSGSFETIILNQIAARAHFIVILTSGSIERLSESGDWLRREIEQAIALQRNIVPILVDNFSFQEAQPYLTGILSQLAQYNGITLHHDYFDAAMEKLRNRFLKQPITIPLTSTPRLERTIVRQQIAQAAQQPAPTRTELSAEQNLDHAQRKLAIGDTDGALADATKALNINPDYELAHDFSAFLRGRRGDSKKAATPQLDKPKPKLAEWFDLISQETPKPDSLTPISTLSLGKAAKDETATNSLERFIRRPASAKPSLSELLRSDLTAAEQSNPDPLPPASLLGASEAAEDKKPANPFERFAHLGGEAVEDKKPTNPFERFTRGRASPRLNSFEFVPASITIERPFELELIKIPAGDFLMGSDPAKDPNANPDEQPQHRVFISEFYIGKYPVTNVQFARFVQETKRKAPDPWKDGAFPLGEENHPVLLNSWSEALEFCKWLNTQVGTLFLTPPEQGFRLPTEAEWEKAARGADGRIYPWDNPIRNSSLPRDFQQSSLRWTVPRRSALQSWQPPDDFSGSFLSNARQVGASSPRTDSPYGVADMISRQSEWCADWYSATEYGERALTTVKDPQGPAQGLDHVVRGGFLATCARRGSLGLGRHDAAGFRIALPASAYWELKLP